MCCLMRILPFALSAALTLPLLVGCAATPSGTPIATSGRATTTGAAATTGATTTPPPSTKDHEAALKSNEYAAIGHALCLKIIDDYYVEKTHTLRAEPKSNTAAFVWPYATFLETLSDALCLYPEDEKIRSTYVDALSKGLDRYRVKVTTLRTPVGKFSNITYYNSTRGASGDYYYDDNAWICLQFLTAYELLGDKAYLDLALELLEFFKTGIDDELGGGIYWDKTFASKNTCANGPVAIAFLTAYKYTNVEEYLEIGRSLYDWLNEKLYDGGLYSDSINKKGEINAWKAAYNQATPITAACLLYEITGESKYLTRANRTQTSATTLCFNIKGRGDDYSASINGNPIYKSWCIGWLMRGYYAHANVSGKQNRAFDAMEFVLKKNESTKTDAGYYDPYFSSGDWKGESTTEVLQPCGVASTYLVCARYDVYLRE